MKTDEQSGYWKRKVNLDAYAWGYGLEGNTFILFPNGIEPRTDNQTWMNYKDKEMNVPNADAATVKDEIERMSIDRYADAPMSKRIASILRNK